MLMQPRLSWFRPSISVNEDSSSGTAIAGRRPVGSLARAALTRRAALSESLLRNLFDSTTCTEPRAHRRSGPSLSAGPVRKTRPSNCKLTFLGHAKSSLPDEADPAAARKIAHRGTYCPLCELRPGRLTVMAAIVSSAQGRRWRSLGGGRLQIPRGRFTYRLVEVNM